VCLVDDQLETAASYLIILQNLERLFTFVIKLQVCLVDDQLETAASYLIILQNLERLFTFVIELQVCLVDDQLETAASYLIILQNLERPFDNGVCRGASQFLINSVFIIEGKFNGKIRLSKLIKHNN
jgi:hypothetical protein